MGGGPDRSPDEKLFSQPTMLDDWYDLRRQPLKILPWMTGSDMELARPIIRRIPGSDMDVARLVISRTPQPMVGYYRLWLATTAA